MAIGDLDVLFPVFFWLAWSVSLVLIWGWNDSPKVKR